MNIRPIKLTLLNHLFYYTEVSGGATSASITGAFIGDLALNYAFHRVLKANENGYVFRNKPAYNEISDFGFYCTVARPLTIEKVKRTENYIRSTAFNADGLIALGAKLPQYNNASKSPYKTFRQVQGIAVGSEFIALLIGKEPFALPPTIRVGITKETLLKVEEVEMKQGEDNFWLNAFTLKTIYNNLEEAMAVLTVERKVNFSYVLENYALIKQLSSKTIEAIFKNKF